MIAGYPIIPFKLCDIFAIYDEHEDDHGTIHVTGIVPAGQLIKAIFPKQRGPRGSWIASSLEPVTTEPRSAFVERLAA